MATLITNKKLQKQEEEDFVWTDECKQLLHNVPKEKGWANWPNFFQYKGSWFTSRQLQGVLTSRTHFKALHSDIILVTFPKSGTTWLKALLFSIVNRKIHPVNAFVNHPLTTRNPHELVPFLERNVYVHDDQTTLEIGPLNRLFATHVPMSCLPSSIFDSNCKIVYLCRDPRDTFVSLWHFIKTGGYAPLEEVFEKFCQGVSVYGPFWDHILGYWKESLERPSKVMFLKFEDLKRDSGLWVKRIAEFLECPFSFEEEKDGVVDKIVEMCSFDHLSNLEVNRNGKLNDRWANKAFFRRGEVGDWVNYLTFEMNEMLVKIVEEKLHGSGLKFDLR